jgi:hypothetical protein
MAEVTFRVEEPKPGHWRIIRTVEDCVWAGEGTTHQMRGQLKKVVAQEKAIKRLNRIWEKEDWEWPTP